MPEPKSDLQKLSAIWDKNPDAVKQFFASKQSTPLTHKALEKWFLSADGKQFYKFPKLMSLPLSRLGVLKGLYAWLSAAVTDKEMKEVTASMKSLHEKGMVKIKESTTLGELVTYIMDERARFSVLIGNLEERQKMILHPEILINIVAAQAIREDEQPDIYVNAIHLEKVNQLKELIDNGQGYFFFQDIQLKTPIDFTKLTSAELTMLYHESKAIEAAFPQIMDLFRSGLKSESMTATSVSS